MIKSFRHKGLKKFFESGTHKGIIVRHAPKLERILDRLDASRQPSDMNLPGYDLHPLIGDMKGTWAVSVDKSWRVAFEFEGVDAILVDYMDYH